MVAPQTREGWLSEQRKYRQFTPDQKTEIVLAGLRGDRSVRDVCREYQIAETLYYQWRERLLEGGRTALANPRERPPSRPRWTGSSAGSASSSGPWAARPTSWRWRGNSRGTGSEGARRPVPRHGCCWVSAGGGGARCGGLPSGVVPAAWSSAFGGWAGCHQPG
jgi:hypothetical protein